MAKQRSSGSKFFSFVVLDNSDSLGTAGRTGRVELKQVIDLVVTHT